MSQGLGRVERAVLEGERAGTKSAFRRQRRNANAEISRARGVQAHRAGELQTAEPVPGDTRVLRLSSTCFMAQVCGPAGWISLRRCLSREKAETFLQRRRKGSDANVTAERDLVGGAHSGM